MQAHGDSRADRTPRSAAPPPEAPEFRERLWPSPGYWVVVPVLATMVALSLLPLSVPLAAGGAVGIGALVAGALVRLSPTVAVTGGDLLAGPARVPVRLLGPASAFSGEEARRERGPGLDARAFLLLRGWVPTVVRVPLDDPQDPTPYWLVSTRRPDELVAALAAAAHATPGAARAASGDDDGRGTREP